MKTLKLSLKILFATVFLLSVAACSKNKDSVKKPDCRIITATPAGVGTDPVNISYNEEGKISTLISGNTTTTFAYSGNTAIATTNSSGVFSNRKIITQNSNGLATNVKTEYDASGTSWDNQALEYSGTQLIKATSTSSTGGSPSIAIVAWADDNMVSLTQGGSITTIDYYTDKQRQVGDYLYLAQLIAGYEIYRTKNLIKSILSGSSITTFTYGFDGEGKITSVTLSGGSSGSYTYQHQCN